MVVSRPFVEVVRDVKRSGVRCGVFEVDYNDLRTM